MRKGLAGRSIFFSFSLQVEVEGSRAGVIIGRGAWEMRLGTPSKTTRDAVFVAGVLHMKRRTSDGDRQR